MSITVYGTFLLFVCMSDSGLQMANVHPWFANVSADQSANWTTTFFQEQDQALADSLSNHPLMYIAETGEFSIGLFQNLTNPKDFQAGLQYVYPHSLLDPLPHHDKFRNHRTPATRTMGLRMLHQETSKSFWIHLFAKPTRLESSTSSSSSWMSRGRMRNSEVLKAGGGYSIRSTEFY